jgi:hypothetical protein
MPHQDGSRSGGRRKGTPNRSTAAIRAALAPIVANELNQLPRTLDKLDPKDRLDVLLRLLPYLCPKVSQISWGDSLDAEVRGTEAVLTRAVNAAAIADDTPGYEPFLPGQAERAAEMLDDWGLDR